MPDEPLDARERAELCDLFVATGPDAPTLCEGWSTLDLAAHLVVREHDVRSGLAILGGDRFASLERKLMDGARAQGYERLIERLRGGPPLVPWRLPGLRRMLNENEWFIHHEDVRRANGRPPRTDRTDLDAAEWAILVPSSISITPRATSPARRSPPASGPRTSSRNAARRAPRGSPT